MKNDGSNIISSSGGPKRSKDLIGAKIGKFHNLHFGFFASSSFYSLKERIKYISILTSLNWLLNGWLISFLISSK